MKQRLQPLSPRTDPHTQLHWADEYLVLSEQVGMVLVLAALTGTALRQDSCVVDVVGQLYRLRHYPNRMTRLSECATHSSPPPLSTLGLPLRVWRRKGVSHCFSLSWRLCRDPHLARSSRGTYRKGKWLQHDLGWCCPVLGVWSHFDQPCMRHLRILVGNL